MHKTNISIVLLKVITKEEASAQRGDSTLSLYTTGKMGSFLTGSFICPLGTVSGLEAKGRYCCGCVWNWGGGDVRRWCVDWCCSALGLS